MFSKLAQSSIKAMY
ncbi:TPA: hypothetical protein ACQ72S_002003 [Escherichia coli]|nr:hypothetical protein [Escherichia coli]EIA0555407.1 hypothetical protein [Escherichia coli]EIH3566458.1 hypothetical protein [Escherichia coli]EIO6348671.1 hypothetical protein [Escherichia coli]EJD3659642.1 hypothetical protein [Escherichia coli]EJF3057485.1 hypothetical protein [Escherichia coli]